MKRKPDMSDVLFTEHKAVNETAFCDSWILV